MSRKDTVLLKSLIGYVNDVKPYHTKFRDVTSEIFFYDKMNVNIKEDHQLDAYFQNIWTSEDIGGFTLTNMSEGIDSDRIFRIPPTVYPKFTLSTQDGRDQIPVDASVERVDPIFSNIVDNGTTISFDYTLTVKIDDFDELVHGFDPSALHITVDGVPYLGAYTKVGDLIALTVPFSMSYPSAVDSTYLVADISALTNLLSQPIINPLTELLVLPETIKAEILFRTHQPDVKVLYLTTGRFGVEYHQGIQLHVDGVLKTLVEDFVVDKTRSFIQFLPGKFPALDSELSLKIFRSDRLFISYLNPFNYSKLSGYDMRPYDVSEYDDTSAGYDINAYDEEDYDSDDADSFYIIIDHTQASGARIIFENTEPWKQKAYLNLIKVESTATDGDVYQVRAIAPWKFTVQKNDGAISYLGFKQTFHDSFIKFIIDRTWANYYVTEHEDYYSYLIVQDNNSYLSYDDFEYGMQDTSDPSEFFSDLAITDEHGIVNDTAYPLHHPVRYQPFGVVKKKTKSTITGNHDYYVFELDEIPARNVYVELRIDQAEQYNPYVNASFKEHLNIFEVNEQNGYDENAYDTEGYGGLDYNLKLSVFDTSDQHVSDSPETRDQYFSNPDNFFPSTMIAYITEDFIPTPTIESIEFDT